jgi:hypothetical protein
MLSVALSVRHLHQASVAIIFADSVFVIALLFIVRHLGIYHTGSCRGRKTCGPSWSKSASRPRQLACCFSDHSSSFHAWGDSTRELRQRSTDRRRGDHVFERRRAEWRRGWDRNRDYLWRGHLCRFTDGRWIIFETGFYPQDYYPNCENGANFDQPRHVGVQSRECLSKNRNPLLSTQRAEGTRHES